MPSPETQISVEGADATAEDAGGDRGDCSPLSGPGPYVPQRRRPKIDFSNRACPWTRHHFGGEARPQVQRQPSQVSHVPGPAMH